MSGRNGTNHCLVAPTWMWRNIFQDNGTSSNQHCKHTFHISVSVGHQRQQQNCPVATDSIVMDIFTMENYSTLEFHSFITYFLFVCNTHLMKVTKFLKEGMTVLTKEWKAESVTGLQKEDKKKEKKKK